MVRGGGGGGGPGARRNSYDKIVPFRNRFQVYFVLETIIFSNDGIFIELIHFLLTLDPVAGTNIKK